MEATGGNGSWQHLINTLEEAAGEKSMARAKNMKVFCCESEFQFHPMELWGGYANAFLHSSLSSRKSLHNATTFFHGRRTGLLVNGPFLAGIPQSIGGLLYIAAKLAKDVVAD